MSSAGPPRNPGKTTIALFGKNPELKRAIENAILKSHKAVAKTFIDIVLKENESFRIINIPDFMDEKYLEQKIIDLMALSDPGPDLFILAIDSEDTGQVEADAQINKLQHIFGENVRKHFVIVAESSKTQKQLSSHYNGKFNIQVVNKNLPDHCKDLLLDQSFQFDSENYFPNAVKRRKGYFESTRYECFPDHHGARGPNLPLQSSPQRNPPEYDPGNAQGWSGPEATIVLLGKGGTGKSASANTILAARNSQLSVSSNILAMNPQQDSSQHFESYPSSTPVTTKCEVKMAEISGTQVRVVDTPDFFYEEENVDQVQIEECKKYCQPWQCVVLLVIQLGRFTDGEREILEKLEKHLEWRIREKTIILFTHGEDFNSDLEEFIGERSHLKQIVEACGDRYYVFKNTVRDSKQVFALFKKFPEMFPNFTAKQSTQCSLF